MTPPPLHLASASPRRRLLLTQHGFEHTAAAPPVDDAELRPSDGVTPEQWVCALSHLKAKAAREAAPDGSVILAADTIVVKDGRIIGQPKDEADARAIVQTLADGSHRVVTGVTLLAPDDRRHIFEDTAHVSVGPIAAGEIDAYIASGGWRGKAGAYNLAERIAAGWPITYHGDPATILGLPMLRLIPLLARDFGIVPKPVAP